MSDRSHLVDGLFAWHGSCFAYSMPLAYSIISPARASPLGRPPRRRYRSVFLAALMSPSYFMPLVRSVDRRSWLGFLGMAYAFSGYTRTHSVDRGTKKAPALRLGALVVQACWLGVLYHLTELFARLLDWPKTLECVPNARHFLLDECDYVNDRLARIVA